MLISEIYMYDLSITGELRKMYAVLCKAYP